MNEMRKTFLIQLNCSTSLVVAATNSDDGDDNAVKRIRTFALECTAWTKLDRGFELMKKTSKAPIKKVAPWLSVDVVQFFQ